MRLTPIAPLAIALFGAVPVAAQVSVGPDGIRSGGTRIDATGIHAEGTDVTAAGVAENGRGGTVIRTNGQTRTVDCDGGRLTVNGNANHLTVRRCSAVTVNGNANHLNAAFAADGRLSVMGNRNTVAWSAPPRVRVAVASPGTRNSVTRR